MVYKKFKFLSWVLVLVMCATFAISALLPEGKRVDISADSSKEFSLSEDDSLGFADTSAAFDKSNVVNVNANVQGKHWMIVSLKGEESIRNTRLFAAGVREIRARQARSG